MGIHYKVGYLARIDWRYCSTDLDYEIVKIGRTYTHLLSPRYYTQLRETDKRAYIIKVPHANITEYREVVRGNPQQLPWVSIYAKFLPLK